MKNRLQKCEPFIFSCKTGQDLEEGVRRAISVNIFLPANMIQNLYCCLVVYGRKVKVKGPNLKHHQLDPFKETRAVTPPLSNPPTTITPQALTLGKMVY